MEWYTWASAGRDDETEEYIDPSYSAVFRISKDGLRDGVNVDPLFDLLRDLDKVEFAVGDKNRDCSKEYIKKQFDGGKMQLSISRNCDSIEELKEECISIYKEVLDVMVTPFNPNKK